KRAHVFRREEESGLTTPWSGVYIIEKFESEPITESIQASLDVLAHTVTQLRPLHRKQAHKASFPVPGNHRHTSIRASPARQQFRIKRIHFFNESFETDVFANICKYTH